MDTEQNVPFAKMVINYVAAVLGIGTFLGFVNLIVGLLSAGWLCLQIYGFVTEELPLRRLRRKLAQHELDMKLLEGNRLNE